MPNLAILEKKVGRIRLEATFLSWTGLSLAATSGRPPRSLLSIAGYTPLASDTAPPSSRGSERESLWFFY